MKQFLISTGFRPVSEALKYASVIIGIKFTIRGDQHMKKDETCVFVSNHQTSLDILGTFAYEISNT